MERGVPTLGLFSVVLLWTLGCASYEQQLVDAEVAEEPAAMPAASAPMDVDGAGYGGAGEGAKARRAAPKRDKKSKELSEALEALGYNGAADAPDAAKGGDDRKPSGNAEVADAEGEEARTRSWFPESLLWQPLVETDDDGVATVPVKVPDQLTTWRVLALAHDRRGQQAGAEQTFVGTLPVYVEPVVPGWLYAGDRVVVPVQAMNTTGDRLSAELTVRATGAASGAAGGALSLSPGGSAVRDLPMDVSGAGTALVTLGSSHMIAIVRTTRASMV